MLDPHSSEDPVEGPLKKPSADSTEQAKNTGRREKDEIPEQWGYLTPFN